jgi:hypothetical protein
LRSELINDRSDVGITMVQMPALNTPQFGWVRSRMPEKAQPVPPIFHPEVAAEAIYYAAHHDRDKLWVGLFAVKAIIGYKATPRLLDRYLARTGFGSQQTDETEDPARKDNLWEPVDDAEDRGALDDRSQAGSDQWWANTYRGLIAGVETGLVAAAHAVLRKC